MVFDQNKDHVGVVVRFDNNEIRVFDTNSDVVSQFDKGCATQKLEIFHSVK